MLLAGDIGATKTDLGIFDLDSGPRKPLVSATFLSGRYPNLDTILDEFLKGVTHRIDRASFGVAGPVFDGHAKITNLPWSVDGKRLGKKLNIKRVEILNDIRAIAHAVLCLESKDLEILNEGVSLKGGAIAVIAPGTGLGEGFLTWDGDRYRTHPSEGGHVDFAPKTIAEVDLMCYLYRHRKHVSYEDVCSGRGIPNIYNFLKEEGGFETPAWLAEDIKGANDPTPVIVGSALGKSERSRICEETLSIFVSVLAREAGNLALKVVATGGLYIGGGIPPRIISILREGRFMEEYVQKGIFSDLLSTIPVYVIMNSKAALIGAACSGLELSES